MTTKQNYYSQTLDTSLMYQIKTENVHEGFSSDKDMFDFSNYSTKSIMIQTNYHWKNE